MVESWRTQIASADLEAVRHTRSQAEADLTGGTKAHLEFHDTRHVDFAANHSFERASVVDGRRLLTLALRHGIGEVTPEGVRGAAERLALLRREEGGKSWVTTPQILEEENRMLRFAIHGKGSCRPIASDLVGWQAGLAQSMLSGEQRNAVSQALTSPDRVNIIRGGAGTGKTTLTREAVRWIEAAGKSVVMLAPSARASRGVLREEGFSQADTLSRFMVDEKMQATGQNGVIWLDEAGLVGSRTMASLFELAGRLDARIVLAGDKKQMAAVERGAALRVLEEIAGLNVSEVTDIRRQAGEYKTAIQHLAKGDAAAGIAKLDQLGWVKTLPEQDTYAPVARDYVHKLRSSKNREKDVLIVCPTHAEGDQITTAVRKELVQAGLLDKQEREVLRLVPTQWTTAQRGDAGSYSGEEILQFHRNSGRFKAGERVTALEAKGATAAHFAAYIPAKLKLSAGESIRITANGKTLDGRHRLNNGDNYRVQGFTKSGDIELSNGWIVAKDFGHLAHGYVATAHASQGRTVEHVLLVQTGLSSPASSREAFYVAASRGRKSATIYTDSKDELLDDASRSRPRPSAIELVRKPDLRPLQRMKELAARARLADLVAAKTFTQLPRDLMRSEQEVAHAR